jgi:hypothetical protein
VRTLVLIDTDNATRVQTEIVSALTQTPGVVDVVFTGSNHEEDSETATLMLTVEHEPCLESKRFIQLLRERSAWARALSAENLERRYISERLQALVMPGFLRYEVGPA